MNKFAVVIPYFGKLKPSFTLWYESARRNPDVDFFVFSDDNEPNNPAPNIRWTAFTLQDFNALAVKKIGRDFTIAKPYKLCDFKPTYGLVFEDYLKGYEYWAFGDVDVLYGKITEFLNKIGYDAYYKLNIAGHLCFMKNVEEMNRLFMASAFGTKEYTDVLESGNVAFDEIDLNNKAIANGYPIYNGILSADLVNEKGMQTADWKYFKQVINLKEKLYAPKNYHYQLFVLENGRVYRYYRRFFKVRKEEYCYVHFRLELPINLKDIKGDTFLLSYYPKGFFDIDVAKLKSLSDFMKIVRNFNNRKPVVAEKFLAAINLVKRFFGRGK